MGCLGYLGLMALWGCLVLMARQELMVLMVAP